MKEEYTRFFDDTENWALGCGGAFATVLVPLIIAAAINTTVGFTLGFLVFLALMTVALIFSMAPP